MLKSLERSRKEPRGNLPIREHPYLLVAPVRQNSQRVAQLQRQLRGRAFVFLEKRRHRERGTAGRLRRAVVARLNGAIAFRGAAFPNFSGHQKSQSQRIVDRSVHSRARAWPPRCFSLLDDARVGGRAEKTCVRGTTKYLNVLFC